MFYLQPGDSDLDRILHGVASCLSRDLNRMERKKVKADLEEGSSNSADPQIEDVLRLGLATGEGVLPGTSSPNSAGGATATIGFFSTFESHKSLKVETFFLQ